MRLLGEDSPVSKLQVKLEPGTLYSRLTPGTHAWHLQALLSCCSLALLGLLYLTMPEFLPRPAWVPIAPRENFSGASTYHRPTGTENWFPWSRANSICVPRMLILMWGTVALPLGRSSVLDYCPSPTMQDTSVQQHPRQGVSLQE